MLHYVFTVRDVKAEAYLPPFILPKVAMAKRTFRDCVHSEAHQFSQNPSDYTLFALGTFDDETARFEAYEGPQSLGNGVEYVPQDNSPEKQNGQTSLSDESRLLESSERGDPTQ